MAPKKQAKVDWKSKCIEAFGLLPLPEGWGVAPNDDQSTWEKYHIYRSSRTGQVSALPSGGEEGREIAGELLGDLKDLTAELNASGCLEADTWLKHVYVSLYPNYEDEDSIRTCEYNVDVFSPYAIPKAIAFQHKYHNRARYYSVEFFVTWWFSLLDFKAYMVDKKQFALNASDLQQRALEVAFPEGYEVGHLNIPGPMYTHGVGELLCSNGLQDLPPICEEVDEEIFHQIENINITNMTPKTVTRLRAWLYGNTMQSQVEGSVACALNDYSLLRLLFTACGSYVQGTSNVGHCWPSWGDGSVEDTLRAEGVLKEKETIPPLSWLDYQIRLLGGALRPTDKYYAPYDELGGWDSWGREVIKALARMIEDGLEEEDEEEDEEDRDERKKGQKELLEELRGFPYMVKERAEEVRMQFSQGGGGMMGGGGGGGDMMQLMMQLMAGR